MTKRTSLRCRHGILDILVLGVQLTKKRYIHLYKNYRKFENSSKLDDFKGLKQSYLNNSIFYIVGFILLFFLPNYKNSKYLSSQTYKEFGLVFHSGNFFSNHISVSDFVIIIIYCAEKFLVFYCIDTFGMYRYSSLI